MALALVIFAGWHPLKLLFGAYLFGFAYMLIGEAQVLGGVFLTFSSFLLQMFPYVLAIFILALTGRRTLRHRLGAPQALGLPYIREDR